MLEFFVMLKQRKILAFFFLGLVTGCAWFRADQAGAAVAERYDENKIIDADRLRRGGTIFVVPFKAGPNIQATIQLDHIALMIVKGIADEVNQVQSPLRILTAENKDYADFLIQGHIVLLSEPHGLQKWSLGKKKKSLAVKGYMIDQKTRKKILLFSQQKEASLKHESYDDLGWGIGSDIGKFILEGQRSP